MELSPGEGCPTCRDGVMWTYCSRVRETGDRRFRVRYYCCTNCGWAPPDNKIVLPLKYAPRRVKMKKPSTKIGTTGGIRLRRLR